MSWLIALLFWSFNYVGLITGAQLPASSFSFLEPRATITATLSRATSCTNCVLSALSPETLTHPSNFEISNQTITTAIVTPHVTFFANGDLPSTSYETNSAAVIPQPANGTIEGDNTTTYLSELVWTTHGVSLTWPTTYLYWHRTFDLAACTSSVALDVQDQASNPFIYPLNNRSGIP